jgi:tryptophan synthase alpha chain
MNNRISRLLKSFGETDRKALSIFITAGYPAVDATVEIVKTLEEAGADIIELGIPFSDPLADGPVIQHSSHAAINNGVTPATVLSIVERIRKDSNIPLVLMGYANPMMRYGIENFVEATSRAGVDGLIVPDIPVEESGIFRRAAAERNIAPILLASPTSSNERLRKIDAASEGFVYCVSLPGVTGGRNGLPDTVLSYLERCRSQITKNPFLVGFGISSGEDARMLAPYADGIIVGSALIKRITDNVSGDYLTTINGFTRELRRGLDDRS